MITFSKLGNYGRLGNQLFQIASTIGIANSNNLEYGFPYWVYSKYLDKELPIFYGYITSTVEYSDLCYKELKVSDNSDIFGYLQSWKFFKDVNIYEIFNLNQKYKNYVKKYNFEKSLSIHVRRGDYLDNGHVYPLLDMDYYERSLNEIFKYHEIDNIYIFSDDIEWCKNNFNFPKMTFVEGNEDIIDLFLMSNCQYNIISNSTFSWWAAYLNRYINKKIICPKVWFFESKEINNFKYDDLIPIDWVKI